MTSFNFITDEEFRESLERDYTELNSCLSCEAWKAGHVLAGSIIEAVLIDSIISEKIKPREEALKLEFTTAIKCCLDNKIISSKTADLCSVIKDYRNLIHAGRVIRLKETVSKESAEVAKALISIVIEEIEKKKRESYGYTAEQIVAKLESDPAGSSIIPHLLKKSNPVELERLMFKIIPEHYISASGFFDSEPYIIPALIECFRTAFELSVDDVKRKVVGRFAKNIREESAEIIFSYVTAFVRATDIQYMIDDDKDLIKEYLIAQLKKEPDERGLTTLVGIGKYLTKRDAHILVDILVKIICQSDDKSLIRNAKKFYEDEAFNTSSEIDEIIIKRLNDWLKMYTERGDKEKAQLVEQFLSKFEIPF
jgi:hypothetical protein